MVGGCCGCGSTKPCGGTSLVWEAPAGSNRKLGLGFGVWGLGLRALTSGLMGF